MSFDLMAQAGRFDPSALFAHCHTTIDEIAPDIVRFSTTVDPNYIPGGFVYNTFLVLDEQPLLYHTGKRSMFPVFRKAFEQVLPFERLRYISFAHGEPDECGALNSILELSPNCVPIVNKICNMVIVSDTALRPSRIAADGDIIDLGKHKLRWFDTPHFPHNWESAMMLDETTRTLFCGDLFTHLGENLPAVTEKDLFEVSEPARRKMGYLSNPRGARPHINRLAKYQPEIAPLLPYVVLLDQIGERLRYRQAGDRVTAAYGVELTGKFLDDAMPVPRSDAAKRGYALAFSTGPLVSRSTFKTQSGDLLPVTFLVLPLSDAEGKPTILLVCFEFEENSPNASLGPNTTIERDHVVFRFL